jgi:hypothetical protein
MRRTTVSLVAAAALAFAGCSLSLPEPEDIRSGKATSCTTSTRKPSQDVVLAGAAIALGLAGPVALNTEKGDASYPYGNGALYTLVPAGIVAFIFGSSAYHGFSSVGACREIR